MAPNKKIAARRLEALAFFADPERVTLKPGADISKLVCRYANLDKRRALPKPGPSTAATIRPVTVRVGCIDRACDGAGAVCFVGMAPGTREPLHHFHDITTGDVKCPNCTREIPLRAWWRHGGCDGIGTAPSWQ